MMVRLLTFLMILTLVLTQGTSMAAAVCRHQNLQEHAAERASADLSVAAVPLSEEAAAAAKSKKASPSGDSSGSWPAPLLPAEGEEVPLRRAETIRLRPASDALPPSATPIPLLKPPSA